MGKTGMDEILCAESIHFQIGHFFLGFGHPCQMEDLINTLDCGYERGLILTITISHFNRKTFQPPETRRLPDEATDLDSPLKKSLNQVAPDKSCGSCDQSLQKMLPPV